jgi:hypothetical protein
VEGRHLATGIGHGGERTALAVSSGSHGCAYQNLNRLLLESSIKGRHREVVDPTPIGDHPAPPRKWGLGRPGPVVRQQPSGAGHESISGAPNVGAWPSGSGESDSEIGLRRYGQAR